MKKKLIIKEDSRKDLRLLRNAISEQERERSTLLLEKGTLQSEIKQLQADLFRTENIISIRKKALAQLEEQKLKLEHEVDNLYKQ